MARNENGEVRYDSIMPLLPSGLIEISCPECGETIQIDAQTGVIIQHKAAKKKPLIEDLHVAANQLKDEAQRRQEAFEKSFATHQSSKHIMDRKFDELLKQAKQDPSETPPRRPFDLD